ncbi:hypothetical protein DPMN_079958 [Dreissena polymorpha]|uniref:Uncharacterized protein n=1 Tax=Dreissena polymorpha TaxID=45954 RepID=A0A9D4BTF2_DREPO|nr:hypothetical protein DPMN_079958 [Dreissena polymorpha]
MTTFHEDWTINVTSRVLTRKTAQPLGSHVFQWTGTIFKLSLAIIRTNVLTKLLTTPPTGGHVFQRTGTILELSQDIIRTNVPNKFHEDWTKNKKTAPSPGGQFHEDLIIYVTSRFNEDQIINVGLDFKFNQDIIRTNLLTKFYEDQTINVISRVLTWQNCDETTKHDGQKLIMLLCSGELKINGDHFDY